MHVSLPDRLIRRCLTLLTWFGAVSAFAGAVLAIALKGSGVPLEHLVHSPFTSYVWPGLILGVVVGGTQLSAAMALLRKRRLALLLSATAGFGMVIWIFIELAMLQQYSWLQTVYFFLGVQELILVLLLLGICPRWPIPG